MFRVSCVGGVVRCLMFSCVCCCVLVLCYVVVVLC